MNGKVVSGLAIVLVLIIAPIGSFFYLRAGLKYRLESQEQLEAQEISESLKKSIIDVITPYHVSLLHLGGDADEDGLDLLSKIDDRIVERDFFEVITNASLSSLPPKTNILSKDINVSSESNQVQFVLLDTSGVVRHLYNFGEDHSKSLIRHLSVVIPMPKSREIKLNREIQDI